MANWISQARASGTNGAVAGTPPPNQLALAADFTVTPGPAQPQEGTGIMHQAYDIEVTSPPSGLPLDAFLSLFAYEDNDPEADSTIRTGLNYSDPWNSNMGVTGIMRVWIQMLVSTQTVYFVPAIQADGAPFVRPTASFAMQSVVVPSIVGATAGREYADDVTGLSVSVIPSVDAGGNPIFVLDSSWANPSDDRYGGVQLFIIVVTAIGLIPPRSMATEMEGSTHIRSGPWPMPFAPGFTYRIYASSISKTGQSNTLVNGVTPSVDVFIGENLGAAGQEYSPFVTSVSATAYYTVDEGGTQRFGFTGGWTLPVDLTYFRGVKVVARPTSFVAPDRILATETAGKIEFKTDDWPIPYTPETYDIYFVSIDASNRSNTITGSTPKVTITAQRQAGATGQEFAPFVTGGSVNLVTRTGEVGQQQFGFDGGWTLPANREKFRGVKVVYRVSGVADRILAVETDGSTTFKTDFWDIPDSSENFTIYLLSIDANNRVNTVTGSTPTFTGTVAKGATGTLKLATRADTSQLGAGLGIASSQLYIPNGSVVDAMMNTLSANKILAGTISVAISLTSPTITSTSGSNQVQITGGAMTISGSTYTATFTAGFLVVNSGGVTGNDLLMTSTDVVLALNGVSKIRMRTNGSNGELTINSIKVLGPQQADVGALTLAPDSTVLNAIDGTGHLYNLLFDSFTKHNQWRTLHRTHGYMA